MTPVSPPMHEPARQIDADEYFAAYPLAAVEESPLNPRRHYDQHALDELAEQMRSAGQVTPGIARPDLSGRTVLVDGVEWLVVELGAGHRRRRALEQAGIPTMQLVRRRLDQVAFVELLQVENLQRDNLHPLEEAAGFRTLMEQAGYDIARIASRVGRDRSYVYDRLKLLQLVPAAQELFLAHRFELGHAVLLARLSPADQEWALKSRRSGNGRIGGLFVREAALYNDAEREAIDTAFDQADPVARTLGLKPVSVRELKGWIDDHVRFRPEAEDLPNLFPETEQALQQAADQELKVVKITRDHVPRDEAKDPAERTFGNKSWKRADGLVAEPTDWRGGAEAKTCDHAVMGVVVAGPGRGEAFLVCTAKKICKVHWAREMREPKSAASHKARLSGSGSAEAKQAFEARLKQEQQERARWEKARPQILTAVTTALADIDVGVIGKLVLKQCQGHTRQRATPTKLAGFAADAVLRQAAYLILYRALETSWDAPRTWPKALKPFAVDPRKIVDQVSPSPKPEKPKPATATKPKKRRVGDVRRAQAKQKRRRSPTLDSPTL